VSTEKLQPTVMSSTSLSKGHHISPAFLSTRRWLIPRYHDGFEPPRSTTVRARRTSLGGRRAASARRYPGFHKPANCSCKCAYLGGYWAGYSWPYGRNALLHEWIPLVEVWCRRWHDASGKERKETYRLTIHISYNPVGLRTQIPSPYAHQCADSRSKTAPDWCNGYAQR